MKPRQHPSTPQNETSSAYSEGTDPRALSSEYLTDSFLPSPFSKGDGPENDGLRDFDSSGSIAKGYKQS